MVNQSGTRRRASKAKKVIEPEEAAERLGCRSWVFCDEMTADLACVSSATSVQSDHPTHPLTGHSISPRTLPMMVTRLGMHSKERQAGKTERSVITGSIATRQPASAKDPERAKKVIEPEEAEESTGCCRWLVGDEMAAGPDCMSRPGASAVGSSWPTCRLRLVSPRTLPVMVFRLGMRSKERRACKKERSIITVSTATRPPTSANDPERAKKVIEPEEAE